MTTSMTPSRQGDNQNLELDPVRSWLRANYPNLDLELVAETVFNDAQAQLNKLDPEFDATNSSNILQSKMQSAFLLEPQADETLLALVQNNFEQLAEGARGQGPDAVMCRDFLGQILLNNGYPLIKQIREWAKHRSCEIFLQLLLEKQFVAQISYFVLAALGKTATVDSKLREQLLTGFDLVVSSSEKPLKSICAETLKDALLIELNYRADTSELSAATSILRKMAQFPPTDVYPFLSALIQTTNSSEIREQAKLVLDELYVSAEKIWDETEPDLISSQDERLQYLLNAATKGSDKYVAETIVYVFKENLATSDEDRRLQALGEFLNANGVTVQMTASLTVVLHAELNYKNNNANRAEGSDFGKLSNLIAKSANVLADIAMCADDTRAGAHAVSLLNRLESVSPQTTQLVSDAKLQASMKFVQREQEKNI